MIHFDEIIAITVVIIIIAIIKTQPKQFWKYVASLKEKSSTSIQLIVDGTQLVDHLEVVDAFANHFQSIYNNSSPGVHYGSKRYLFRSLRKARMPQSTTVGPF
jgi:hypothetical protein